MTKNYKDFVAGDLLKVIDNCDYEDSFSIGDIVLCLGRDKKSWSQSILLIQAKTRVAKCFDDRFEYVGKNSFKDEDASAAIKILNV